jgi:hypothetical protein
MSLKSFVSDALRHYLDLNRRSLRILELVLCHLYNCNYSDYKHLMIILALPCICLLLPRDQLEEFKRERAQCV